MCSHPLHPGCPSPAFSFEKAHHHGKHLFRKLGTCAAAVFFAIGISGCSTKIADNKSAPATETTQQAAIDMHDVDRYLAAARNELVNDILPYWEKHAPNDANDGFYGAVDADGVPDRNAPRGSLLSSRILWTFSAAYRLTGDPKCLAMAKRAYADLDKTFIDKKNGGLYWLVAADGKVLDPNKMVYVQAFGIYGLSEYYRATGDKEALGRAIALYHSLEAHARDHTNGGYREEFTADWVLQRERGVFHGGMGSRDQKSQNAHLHIMEAYANLLRVWPDAQLRRDLAQLEDTFANNILNQKTNHLYIFQSDDWKPHNDAISYGHDIEFSWLLVEAAEVVGDKARLERAKAIALRVAQVTAKEGLALDGSIINEGNIQGPTDRGRIWWAQAEATVGFLGAWQISGDPAYFHQSRKIWDFIDTRMVDHRRGEWYEVVDAKGVASTRKDKIGFWKCPYHNSRACMEIIARLESVKTTLSPQK